MAERGAVEELSQQKQRAAHRKASIWTANQLHIVIHPE